MARLLAPRLMAAALAAGVCAAAGAVGPAAAQEQALRFDIGEQSLSTALVEFSRRSGIVVVAPAHLVTGKRAPAVRGVLTPDAALGLLLARSGLEPRRRPEGGLTLVASAPATASASQHAIDAPAPAAEAPIVVTGQRLRTIAMGYATALAGPQPSSDQIPRWNMRLCPSVAGLSGADAQTLIDHIARRAHQIGLAADGSGCQPNVVIIFAEDSDIVARRIVETRRDLLGYLFSEETITAGREALDEFANTPRAVRSWHVSRLAMVDGEQPTDSGVVLSAPSTANNAGSEGLPAGAHTGAFRGVEAVRSQGSRMRRDRREDLNFVLVIADTRRMHGASQAAIADYLAMTVLAKVSPRGDMSEFDSILNLFEQSSGGTPPAEMTIWDLAYLRALYEARPDAASVRQQNTDISRRMAEQVYAASNGEAP